MSLRTHDDKTGRLKAACTEHDDGTGLTTLQDLTFVFDVAGNLIQRTDAGQGLIEDFTYDTLNRVTSVVTVTGADPSDSSWAQPASLWSGGSTTTVDVIYDSLGNIVSKTGIGAYTYGEDHGCGAGIAGPHAVSSITSVEVDEKNTTYCYDANGNLLSGDGRTTAWSPFDKPIEITKGSETVEITYGPDRERYKRVDTGATNSVTHYVGGKLYEAIVSSGVDERKHYIGDFAVITDYVDTGARDEAYYLTDHLGSIDLVTDASGGVIERMSFDAWGKRRESGFVPPPGGPGWAPETGWVPILDPSGFEALTTTRGYTGHEQLDPVGLVHMNGRVYDPEIGRFMSADPLIQAPFNLQNLNRYSYVLNNPLSLIDPTGLYYDEAPTSGCDSCGSSPDAEDSFANSTGGNSSNNTASGAGSGSPGAGLSSNPGYDPSPSNNNS
ncbi:MAG: hypothetical protein GY788_22145, partial [bacterium]|nr:hypothetical protein [bacterium]